MKDNANTANGNKSQPPGFYTVNETASYLHLCEKQVRRLISRGELPAYRFGTALRIKKKDIETYAESQRIRVH
jgi:excisionase family DNA binding protein